MKSIFKTHSRFLVALLTVALALSTLPLGAFAETYGDVTVSIPAGEDLTLGTPTQSGNTFTYTVQSDLPGYNPYNFSLNVVPDANVTVTVNGADGAAVTQDGTLPGNTTYWLVTPSTANASSVRIVSSGGYTYIINCSIPSGAASAGTGIYAYLPAAGQFANEGVDTGGWGDAFVSGSTALKGIVGANAATGVSLGFFGGYVVLDMGEDIANASTNPYGVDFIVYGNAFAGNSEPGGIQVAEGKSDGNGGFTPGDVNNDGIVWYDIAGSLHYDDTAVWDANYTYTNPAPADDTPTTPPQTGTLGNSVPYTYSNIARPSTPPPTPETGSGYVTYNTFHRHSWFPLNANYFQARNSIGPLDRTAALPFAAYNLDTTNGSTLTLEGVLLSNATSTATANYTFGYADVHPNGSAYGTAQNPYIATASTTGGDGIDISWAVNSSGEPVALSSIRFVRVYTAAAYVNGSLGEISTEVSGVYKATPNSSAVGVTATPIVKFDGNDIGLTFAENGTLYDMPGYGASQVVITISGSGSGTTYTFLNSSSSGTLTVDLSDGKIHYVRAIAQNGDDEPYIVTFGISE